MSLEEIEKELYRVKAGTRVRRRGAPSPQRETPIPRRWEEAAAEPHAESQRTVRLSPFIKFLIGAALFGALLLAGSIAFFVSSYVGRNANIGLEVSGPKSVLAGQSFELEIHVSNETEAILRDARLSVSLPAELVNLTSPDEREGGVSEESIGDIGSGSLTKKTLKLLPVGKLGLRYTATFQLLYFLGRKTPFVEEASYEVEVTGSAIELDVEEPDQVVSGGAFNLTVQYKNVSSFDFGELVLQAAYPPAFKFLSSTLEPSLPNNTWNLGGLRSGSSGKFTIQGAIEGGEENAFRIPFMLSMRFLGKDYPIAEASGAVKIAAAPIRLEVAINQQPQYVARIGDRLRYSIRFENSSGVALRDVVLTATLIGELFDFGTIDTDAYRDPITNVLTWNAATTSELKLLEPGASGEARFDIQLKKSYPMRRLSDKNFYLRLKAEIDSPTVPYYLSGSKTQAVATHETKVAGAVLVDAQGYFRDAPAHIVNNGAMPPKVGEPTEYTIHWVVRNFATDLKDVSVRTVLQPGVGWTGVVKSNTERLPSYNERTGEVTWHIDKIPATKGILGDPLEAVFQIRAIPLPGHDGRFQLLISETTLRAVDEFTGITLEVADLGIDTSLPDDKSVGQEKGKVVR